MPETVREGSGKLPENADPSNASAARTVQAPPASLIDTSTSSASTTRAAGGNENGALSDLAGLTINSSSKEDSTVANRGTNESTAVPSSQHLGPNSAVPPRIVKREDSQTHDIDEFVDAES
jgi:hypothetical protein